MKTQISLEILFEEKYKLLYKIIYCITNDTQDTFDILHDTYLKARSKFDPYRSEKECLKWLVIIARNTALTFMKKKNKWQCIDNYVKTFYTKDISLDIFFLYSLDNIKSHYPDDIFEYLLMNIVDGVSLFRISKETRISYEKLRYWKKILTKELKKYLKNV